MIKSISIRTGSLSTVVLAVVFLAAFWSVSSRSIRGGTIDLGWTAAGLADGALIEWNSSFGSETYTGPGIEISGGAPADFLKRT